MSTVESPPCDDISFSKQMRQATREVHSISDALVNAKLVFALTDDLVWLDGLVVFRPIFQWLEHNVPDSMLPAIYHRSNALDDDIRFYCESNGIEWANMYDDIRPAVLEYLDHLDAVKENDPRLLWAYVYHLYMGLLSGGQILHKKHRLTGRSRRSAGTAGESAANLGYQTTTFNENVVVLKQRMRDMMDEAALTFDDELKERLIEESKKVFELNNKIVRTVRGVQAANIKKVVIVISAVLVAYVCWKWMVRSM